MDNLLTQLGITSGASVLLFFIMQKVITNKTAELEQKNAEITDLQNKATEHRKAERDLQFTLVRQEISGVDKRLDNHLNKHEEWEKNLYQKIDRIYDRINPMADNMSKILGYMEAAHDKSK